MKSCRLCLQNLRKWQTDYRVWCIAFLLAAMVAIYVDDMRKISDVLNTELPIWIYPFLYSQFHTKVIYTLPLVLLFCNAPFTDKNQIFVYMRTGRIRWLTGQILYIITASAAYYAFILALSILFSLISGGEFSLEWGKTLQTISKTYIAAEVGASFVTSSSYVTVFFTPLLATWFTFLMSWICGIFLGLIIFLLNLVTQTQIVGVLTASAVVVLSSAIYNDGWGRGKNYYVAFSPLSWITLDNIDVGGTTSKPTFTYCITAYLLLILILVAAIFIFGRKKSLDIRG